MFHYTLTTRFICDYCLKETEIQVTSVQPEHQMELTAKVALPAEWDIQIVGDQIKMSCPECSALIGKVSHG